MKELDNLKEAIQAKDVNLALQKLQELKTALAEDNAVLAEFLKPVTITELHKLIVENFDIKAGRLKVKRRVSMARPRAFLFIAAMEAGIKSAPRVIGEK